MSVVGKGDPENDAAERRSDGGREEGRQTLFRFSDTVVSAGGSLNNSIGDEAARK
jgi:hypothetical protein